MSAPRASRVWRAPMGLAALSAVGLVAALLSDGPGDVLAWLTLAAPVAVVAWCASPRVQRTFFRPGAGR